MIEVIVYSIIFAIVAATAVAIGVVKYYKRGLFSAIYPLEHYTKMDLRHRNDVFINRTVTRVKVSSDSNKKK